MARVTFLFPNFSFLLGKIMNAYRNVGIVRRWWETVADRSRKASSASREFLPQRLKLLWQNSERDIHQPIKKSLLIMIATWKHPEIHEFFVEPCDRVFIHN